jgi:CubicO group peptidase (beta-lactamase class C family)
VTSWKWILVAAVAVVLAALTGLGVHFRPDRTVRLATGSGLLYLNDGVVGGKRILHEDWVDFCAAATLNSDYAAGFYTNRSDHPDARGRVHLGMPSDSFFASGLLGQRIVIMPSQRLIVVRLGDSVDPTGDIRGVARLVKEVIAAVQP